MTSRRAALPLLAALAVAGALAAGPAPAASPDLAALGFQPYDPPTEAPAFTLPDLDGTPRSLASLRGKVVLVFFWATW
jgi:cytochrome oxidase Cu insertion factor (SCO1/SenC/PrrC family)